jgi:hypothetical protein
VMRSRLLGNFRAVESCFADRYRILDSTNERRKVQSNQNTASQAEFKYCTVPP